MCSLLVHFFLFTFQSIILNLPLLTTLNVSSSWSRNDAITNKAFLVYPDIQKRREISPFVSPKIRVLTIFFFSPEILRNSLLKYVCQR